MYRIATIIQPKPRTPTMKIYCGIDLHATNSFLCVIDDMDNISLKEKVKNDLGAIFYALESFFPKPSVVVEATINWSKTSLISTTI
jgi:hypothetical protein